MSHPREIKHILYTLDHLPGITRHYVLTPSEKKYVDENENQHNVGVHAAVRRNYCVCLVHDSSWREPTQTIARKENGITVFPPVVFPEVPAKNVVSSSPSLPIHSWLKQRVRVEGDEATLLIGFDL